MKLLRNHKNKKNIKSHVIMISKKKKKVIMLMSFEGFM